MSKYKIKIKRDFGPYGFWNSDTRQNEYTGFVVVKDGCNCMPGAVWFRTIADAMLAVEVHMITGDDPEFYSVYKQKKIDQFMASLN